MKINKNKSQINQVKSKIRAIDNIIADFKECDMMLKKDKAILKEFVTMLQNKK